MCEDYLKKINLILSEQLEIDQKEFTYIVDISIKIIYSLCKDKELISVNWFNFSYLHKLADYPKNQSFFFKSVYLLANPRVNFIIQRFHYFNEVLDTWEEYPDDLYYLAILNKDFIHPSQQTEISYEDFLNTVVPYFSLTNESLKSVSKYCGC